MPPIRRLTHPRDMYTPAVTVRRSEPLLPLIPILVIVVCVLYFAGLGRISTGSSEFMLIAVSAALFVYLLTLINIQFGIAILIFSTALSPEMVIMGVGNLRVEDFIVPILVVAWVTRLVDRSQPFAPTHLKGPILAYLAAGLVSCVLGIAIYNMPPLRCVFYYGKYMEYYLIFLLMINLVKTPEEVKNYIIVFMLAGLGVSLQGIMGVDIQLGGFTERRIHGPAGETGNIMGGYLIQVMGISLGMLLHAGMPIRRLFSAVVLVMCSLAFMMTLSRTSYVALVSGILVYGVLRRRSILVFMLLAMFIIPQVAPNAVQGRITTVINLFSGNEPPTSWQARVSSWQQLSNSFAESPLFGRGIGYYDLGWVDNEYMRTLSEMGIVGGLMFVWFLLAVGQLALLKADAYPRDGDMTGFAHGFIISFVCMLVHGMGVTSFSTIRTMETFIVLLGIRVAIDNGYPLWFPEKEAAGRGVEPLFAPPMLRTLHR